METFPMSVVTTNVICRIGLTSKLKVLCSIQISEVLQLLYSFAPSNSKSTGFAQSVYFVLIKICKNCRNTEENLKPKLAKF